MRHNRFWSLRQLFNGLFIYYGKIIILWFVYFFLFDLFHFDFWLFLFLFLFFWQFYWALSIFIKQFLMIWHLNFYFLFHLSFWPFFDKVYRLFFSGLHWKISRMKNAKFCQDFFNSHVCGAVGGKGSGQLILYVIPFPILRLLWVYLPPHLLKSFKFIFLSGMGSYRGRCPPTGYGIQTLRWLVLGF